MGLERQKSTGGGPTPAAGEDSHLRLLVERAPVAMGIVSRKGVIEYANPTLERVFGRELAAAGDLVEFVRIGSPSDEEAKRALAFWHDEILGERTDQHECEPFQGRVVTPGGIKEVVFRSMVMGGKVVAVLEDVTGFQRAEELKQANRALRASEAKYRKLHESMSDAFVSVTMDGQILEHNQAYRDMLGYSGEELLELTYIDLTPVKWHPFEERILQEQILPQGFSEVYEKEYRRKDGDIIPVELRTFLIRDDAGEPAGMWAIVREISKRKELEKQLRRSNAELKECVAERTAALEDRMARYRSLFNALADMVLVVDAEGRILEANDAAVGYLGYSREDLLSMSHTDLQCDVPPEERAKVREKVISGKSVNTIYRLIRKDGSSFPAEVTISPGEADGEPVALAMVRDITERMVAEEALRQSEERYRKLSNAASEGIAVTQDGIIVDVNQRLADIVGYTVDEMIGRPALEFIAPAYRELVAHNMGIGIETPYEADFLHKDGSSIRMEGRGVATTWNGREARVSALRDLTEARRLEAELAEQRTKLARLHKVAMLSEVSAGVIHQISQPLCAIGNNVAAALNTLRSAEDQAPGVFPPLADAEQDLRRLRQTMNRLRALAHPDQQNRVVLDLNQIVEESIELAGNAGRRGGIRFEVSLAPEFLRVHADAVQLGQALLNLLQNAIDALTSCIPDRRRIEIVTGACNGAEVEVQVRDTGPGISPDVQARLFEPFFTTKPEGMGIGLSLSHTIVTAHGGRMEARNNKDGIGATFRVVIPHASEDR